MSASSNLRADLSSPSLSGSCWGLFWPNFRSFAVWSTDPWVSMLYATPIIALGPLFILWLGIGIVSKIAIVFLVAVFPILINTVSGLTTTDRTLIEVAQSFGANAKQIYTKVRMPAAIPFIIAGLRLSVARALVGVVVAVVRAQVLGFLF